MMARMSQHTIEVRPLGAALGAEIAGVDLAKPQPDGTIKEIREALLAHQVIFFREQSLTIEQHEALGRCFGDLDIHPYHPHLEGHPEVLVLETDQTKPEIAAGDAWHADLTALERPPLGSILYAREIPSIGGDTIFASMYAAYDALSERMKSFLEGLTAVHDMLHLFAPVFLPLPDGPERCRAIQRDHPPVEHPIVRTHPETGRKALFVNGLFTSRVPELSARESAALLGFLYEHIRIPEFQCRFRWEGGSVAFWDNRCTQHYPVADYWPERRCMHRVTIAGDRPR
jgi:taurine dioxygenase